mgnify:CR=1 FL=1
MTQVTRRELIPGVWLRAIHTDKFKSSYLGLTMLTPLERETAAANALIPAVLRRGTASHPDLEALFVENAEPTSPFGTKALGEPPACSPAPAIRSAIYNATGVSIDTTPITPHVLYRAFKEAGLIHDEKEGD